jgi:hypothetical protein
MLRIHGLGWKSRDCCLPLFLVLGPKLVFHSSGLWSLQAWEPVVSTCVENSAAFLVAVASSRGLCLRHNRSMAGPRIARDISIHLQVIHHRDLSFHRREGRTSTAEVIAALVVVVFLAA